MAPATTDAQLTLSPGWQERRRLVCVPTVLDWLLSADVATRGARRALDDP